MFQKSYPIVMKWFQNLYPGSESDDSSDISAEKTKKKKFF